jgi:hypothetical protein
VLCLVRLLVEYSAEFITGSYHSLRPEELDKALKGGSFYSSKGLVTINNNSYYLFLKGYI